MTSQMDKTKLEIDLSCNALCLYGDRTLRLDQQNSKFLDPFESTFMYTQVICFITSSQGAMNQLLIWEQIQRNRFTVIIQSFD